MKNNMLAFVFIMMVLFQMVVFASGDSISINSLDNLITISESDTACHIKVINMRGLFLDEAPAEIQKFINLEALYLDANHLKIIPESFWELKKLKKLSLEANADLDILKLIDVICFMPSLESLDLANCGLYYIPSQICRLKRLKELDLSANGLRSLPPEIDSLQSLGKLRLNSNPICLDSIASSIKNLRQVKELDFADCEMDSWSENAQLPSNVEDLTLCSNKIKAIPANITKLKNLKYLNLADNDVQKIDNGIVTLKELSLIILHANPHLSKDLIDELRLKMPHCEIITGW